MEKPPISLQSRLGRYLAAFEIHPRLTLSSLEGWPRFRRRLAEFRRQRAASSIFFAEGTAYPCLRDWKSAGGTASGDYFHQDLLVAQKIYERNPRRHLDIGSRVDGFIAHVAVFREIEVLDIRPLETSVKNIKFTCADLSAPLPPELVGCCDSLSCLHTIEHFGLGRYGDPVNYTGYLDGLRNMKQIVHPGGKFYFSTQIGPQRVEFDAHRVFSLRYLIELLSPDFRIDSLSYVDDRGQLTDAVDLGSPDIQRAIDRNFDCHLGVAIFDLTRL